ncbi:MAG: sacsin N-terminal ATP-binding-like domain-containing protein [Thermoplasmatota archaeon]
MTYGVDLMDFVRKKVGEADNIPGDRQRFVFRELTQNADDAQATTLIARFTDDALEVSNDGFDFSTRTDSHFQRIVRVLSFAQEDDPNTTGNFGSGFTTVYSLTNHPEVHSNGVSVRFNPTSMDRTGRVEFLDGKECLEAPFSRGVLFRFPWRTKKEAERSYDDGQTPFKDESVWRRWSPKQRRDLYDDLVEYLHDLILCAQHLRHIRLVWDIKSTEAFQVSRTFDCGPRPADAEQKPNVESLFEGTCKPLVGAGEAPWESRRKEYRYLVCHGRVRRPDGTLLWMGRGQDRTFQIVAGASLPASPFQLVKKNDVWLLWPLFPAAQRSRERRVVYSAIPIATRSMNRFVCSGHLFPEEGRKSLSVEGGMGMHGRWLDAVRASLMLLWRDTFNRFAREVRDADTTPSAAQETLLDAMPCPHPDGWLKPDAITGAEEEQHPETLALYRSTLDVAWIWSEGEWRKPNDCLWPDKATESLDVMHKLHVPAIEDVVSTHEYAGPHLASVAPAHSRFVAGKFAELWGKVSRQGVPEFRLSGRVNQIDLDEDLAQAVCTLLFRTEFMKRDVARQQKVVPTISGRFVQITELYAPADGADAFEHLLPSDTRPHPSVATIVASELTNKATPAIILRGIHEHSSRIDPATLLALYDCLNRQLGNQEKFPDPGALASVNCVLSATGAMVPPSGVCRGGESDRKLVQKTFEKAGVQIVWVRQDLERLYEDVLKRIGVRPPPFDRLFAASGLAGILSLGPAMVKDFLDSIADADPRQLKGMAFLPSGTQALTPAQALLGETGFTALDAFCGVINQDFQKLLDALPALKGNVEKLGANRVDGHAVYRKIDDLATRQPEAELDDHSLRAVTEAVVYWTKGAPIDRFRLPCVRLGRAVIGPSQRRPVRTDDYEPEWVFAGIDDELATAPQLVVDGVRILHLHPDVGGAAKASQSKDVYGLRPLQPGSNIFTRCFIVGDRSLFRPGQLERHVTPTTALKPMVEESKLELLESLLAYFDRPKTDAKPSDMEVLPCLVDSEGTWRTPLEFVRDDAIAREIGLPRLGPIPKSWPIPTLQALGVPENVTENQLHELMKSRLEEADRPALTNLAFYTVLSGVELRHAGWAERAWVPTHAGLKRCADTLAPLADVSAVVGAEFPSVAILPPAGPLLAWFSKEAASDPVGLSRRFEAAEIRTRPSLRELLEILADRMGSSEPPSPGLFAAIEAALEQETPAPGTTWGYYSHDRWWPSDAIYTVDTAFLPKEIRDQLVTLVDSQYPRLMAALGAKSEIDIAQLGSWLKLASVGHDDLWQAVASRSAELATIRNSLRASPIHVPGVTDPVESGKALLVRGERVLRLQNHVFLPLSLPTHVQVVLLALGARSLESLEVKDLVSILGSISPAPQSRDAIAILLQEASRRKPDKAVPVPCTRAGNSAMTPVGEAYLKDGVAAEAMEPYLPMVDAEFVDNWSEFMRWAEPSGLRRVSATVEVTPLSFRPEEVSDDPGQQAKLRLLAAVLPAALSRRLNRDVPAKPFQWLANARVCRVDFIEAEFRHPIRKVSQYVPILVQGSSPNVKVILPKRGLARDIPTIARTLYRRCAAEGLQESIGPAQDRQVVQHVIADLLRSPTNQWAGELGIPLAPLQHEPGSIIEVIDDTDDLAAYYKVRRQLAAWYQGCQICYRRTPATAGETLETVKAVVSLRGGLYKGPRRPDVDNNLWLCPICQKLFERALIKIPFLDDEDPAAIAKAIRNMANVKAAAKKAGSTVVAYPGFFVAPVEVYDIAKRQVLNQQPPALFHVEHLEAMLKWFEQFLLTGRRE